jgi:uncharacterized protein YjbJ (UPF0337 family)
MMTTSNEVKTTETSGDGLKAPEVKRNEVQGNWIAQKDKLKKKFGTLTDEDLAFEEGKKDEMLVRVQTKIGKSKEELQAIIAAL